MSLNYQSTLHDKNDSLDVSSHQLTSSSSIETAAAAMTVNEDNQLFTGMHHIFDHHKEAVTRVHFANNDTSLIACSSLDCTLSICQLTPTPATVLYILKGHSKGVTDFEWSVSNDHIISSSLDFTIRLWDTASGACLRVINDPSYSPIYVTTFQPINNNMIVTGNGKGLIHVFNVSTGIIVKGSSVRVNTSAAIQSICFENNGKILWVGDSKGFITSFLYELTNGRLIRLSKILLNNGSSITSISIKQLIDANSSRHSYLLINRVPNSLMVLRVNQEMRLNLLLTLNVKHENNKLTLRSVFSPINTKQDGICIVSASEDGIIYLFKDFHLTQHTSTRPHTTKLEGHSSSVLHVCFNFDQSLLASSDICGNVIVWKKENL